MIFSQIEMFTIYTFIVVALIISLIYYIYEDFYLTYDIETNTARDKAQKKTTREYIDIAHSGLIRGLIFGIIMGDLGLMTGIRNAAIYSTLNPAITYIGY